MKFKEFLEKNRYPAYENNYLNFEKLSKLSKECLNQENELKFREFYDSDLSKVFGFIDIKYEELENRAHNTEKNIEQRQGKKMLETIQNELYMFAEFIRINIEGFKVILRKHDKISHHKIRNEYQSVFKQKLDELEGLNALIYNLSRLKLKTIVVDHEKESNISFIRKTEKYWVHPENLYSLKAKIINHLPVYVFNGDSACDASPYSAWDSKTHDTCVSSVYLDNTDASLYYGRLYKNHGAEAIRIRWYGRDIPNVVFIERKRHEDKWTGYKSKKLRFKIDEKFVVDYLNGKNVWEHVKLLNGPEVFDLYKELQTTIITKKLRPMVRTFYKRIAFQLPNDSSVRISLDTNLTMIRECNTLEYEQNVFPLRSWIRKDAVCEWPFKNINKSDIVRFPYAILEVKTQGVNEIKPDWINDIANSHYVENVHKYSKFMHGCAVLFKNIKLIPYWLPQMSVDIRKHKMTNDDDTQATDNYKSSTIAESVQRDSSDVFPPQAADNKITIPARIEPKVFFANERTFLKWVQFSIFLGGIGTAILGFGENESVWCGSMLMLVSILFILYALYTFNWRIHKIKQRKPGPYDDLIGPTVLLCFFLLALVFSVIFKYPKELAFWE